MPLDPSQILQTDAGAPLKRFSPEELMQIMRLGTQDDRQKMLDEQMAQAQALRKPGPGGSISPAGASFGGLADLVNNISGMRKEKDLRGQQNAALDGQDQTMLMLAQALRGGGQPQGPPEPGIQSPTMDPQFDPESPDAWMKSNDPLMKALLARKAGWQG